MKRFLACALAAIGMVACVSEDVVQLPKSDAISFANAFIGNSTRAAVDPSTTEATLEAFDVWAYMTSVNGTVLVDEDVELNGNIWEYDNIQYWTPNKNYFFAALAPMESANWDLDASKATFGVGAGEVTFENIDGGEDLIYATASVTTPSQQVLLDKGMEAVKFQFQHLLSKVKFTFHNGFSTKNASIKVSNVTMTAPKEGTIDLGQGYDWVLGSEARTFEFGDAERVISKADGMYNFSECARERLTIPADATYTYNIEFDVTLYYGTEEAYKVHKTSTVTGQELKRGYAYNFWTEINPENLELLEIVFEVEGVDEWVPAGGEQVDYETGTIYVYNRDELQAALDNADGENYSKIVVCGDIIGDVTAIQKNGVHLTVDGDNHKFEGTLYLNGQSSTGTSKSLTIKNFNFETTDSARDFISCWEDAVRYARNITIENCTFKGAGNDSDVAVLRLRQCYDIHVKDCVATDVHSFAQIKSSEDMTFEGVTVNGGRGFNFQTAAHGAVEFNNCDITATKADGYGIRVDVYADRALTINNTTINAYEPIVLRNAKKSFTLYVNNSELIEVGEYEIVIIGETPVIYIDGLLYGGQKKNIAVDTVDELKAALEDSAAAVIELAEGEYDLNDKIYYMGAEKLIKAAAGSNTVLKGKFVANADLTVANVKFAPNAMSTTNLDSGTYGTYVVGGYSAIVTVNKVAAYFEGCEFDGGANYVVGINYFGDAAGKVLNVNNCTFNQSYIYSKVLCNITNNTFNLNECPYPICVWPRPAGSTNSTCAFVGNTVNSNFNSTGKAHCYVMLLSQSTPYANVEFNVQNNTGDCAYTYSKTGGVTFDMSTITFAAGSETF